MNIHIASKCKVQADAVSDALSPKYVIWRCESESGIDNQPIGMEMIEKGALNRLNCVPFFPCVAFETGIILTKKDTYQEISCVVLRTPIGDFHAWTPFEFFKDCPLTDVDEWKQLKKQEQKDTTLASIIAKNYKHAMFKDDWYFLTGFISRQDTLRTIFEQVWTKFVRTYESLPIIAVIVQQHNNVPFIDMQYNLLHSPLDLAKSVKHLADRLLFDTVIVADARGFLLAGEFMRQNNQIRIVMARKPGKLPSEVYTQAYEKEYGFDEICIEVDAIPENSSVIIIDDVIASGGTMRAIMKLVEGKFRSNVAAFIAPFAIERSPGKLMCNGKIPLEKVRFAQTQLILPRWGINQESENSFCHPIQIIPPSLQSFSSNRFNIRAKINWKQFNSSSNITFDGNEFKNKDVHMFLNTTNQSEMYECLSLLKILYRKDPKSIHVIIPFVEQATQDRIEYNEDCEMETLAQIDTLAKLIGKHTVRTYDIHAEQSILAFHDLRNDSIVEVLWKKFHHLHPTTIPVFGDDGAAKRFANLLKVKKTCITFRKTRGEGDIRLVETEDTTIDQQDYVIVDDLVRSGSTMHNVALYLIQNCNAKSVSALFAHAPLEPKCCKNLRIFEDKIWTSNSCPEKVPSRWVKYNF